MGLQHYEGHLRLVYIAKLRDLSRLGAGPGNYNTMNGVYIVCEHLKTPGCANDQQLRADK